MGEGIVDVLLVYQEVGKGETDTDDGACKFFLVLRQVYDFASNIMSREPMNNVRIFDVV